MMGTDTASGTGSLQSIRFHADRTGAQRIIADPQLRGLIEHASRQHAAHGARKQLLGQAVRVDAAVLPAMHRAVDELRDRAGLEQPIECFVYQNPCVEAFVMRSADRFFVLLSSAAVEKLTPGELEFVIGHELGHVIYDHLTIPVSALLHHGSGGAGLSAKQAMALLSWQRRAEISADRVGLICCGSIDLAASAFFKALSGLNLPDLQVNPIQFANQFDHLKDEIWRLGSEDLWTMTHPLPPLRVKSMLLFWQSRELAALLPDAPGEIDAEVCNRQIANLLSYMDPLSERDGRTIDPMLGPMLLWGGLYIAICHGEVEQPEVAALSGLVGQEPLEVALREPRSGQYYLQRFYDAVASRQKPLSALDMNRVFTSLAIVMRADGSVDAEEVRALHELAGRLGIAATYVDCLIQGLDS